MDDVEQKSDPLDSDEALLTCELSTLFTCSTSTNNPSGFLSVEGEEPLKGGEDMCDCAVAHGLKTPYLVPTVEYVLVPLYPAITEYIYMPWHQFCIEW